ncbi:hypothetical protein [Thermococcus zilligii]|uniref:hypothetical protein n=1 Tax=Thermococcus zilligii TaxID=54076 RepID=UPI00307A9B60
MMQVGVEKAQGQTQVVIVNFDEGRYGEVLIKALNATPNVTVALVEAPSLYDALKLAREEKRNVLVVIPANFSESIESNRVA